MDSQKKRIVYGIWFYFIENTFSCGGVLILNEKLLDYRNVYICML